MRKGYEQAHADDLHFARLRGRIQVVYAEAERDLRKKLEAFVKRYKEQDKIKRQQLAAGEITQQQYEVWLRGQVFQGERWKSVKQSAADQIYRANQTATELMNDERKALFQDGANYSAFQIEKGTKGAIRFDLYDNASVTRLLKDNPKMLPDLKIGKRKDESWNRRGIQNAITQGIIQGESIPDIAKRIGRETGERNRKAMIRQARTAMTGAQNAGRMAAMHDAKEMGIKVKKKWIATLDSKTRDTHAELDGQEVDEDQPFVVNGMEIMYPGDPNADPSLVYNCRCTLGWVYPDYPANGQRRDNETGEIIDDVSYREWEKAKEKTPESTMAKPVHVAVDGQDITMTWTRRKDEFKFEIEDVINAQGYDGVPQVVDAKTFEQAVKESGFIAQREYAAPTQEILDAYKEQLYSGKWYVDCSTGGAQYGQGMYCAADYTGTITEGMRSEMAHYQELNESRGCPFSRTETFTLMKGAKIIEFDDVMPTFYGKLLDDEAVSARAKEYGLSAKWCKLYKEAVQARLDYIKLDNDKRNRPDFAELKKYARIANKKEEKALDQAMKEGLSGQLEKAVYIPKYDIDAGSIAARMGYDAINAVGHGDSGSYTVVLNRTKVIFRGDEYD